HRDLHSFPTRRSSDLAADRAFALLRIVRVEDRHLQALDLFATGEFPNTDVADAVGAGKVFAVRAEGHDIKGGDVALRRPQRVTLDRKSTRLNSSHLVI